MCCLLIYLLVALDFNFESYIRLVLDLISVFITNHDRFSFSISIFDFSTNSNPNSMIFDSADSSWSYLS